VTDRERTVYYFALAIASLHKGPETHWENIAEAECFAALALVSLARMDPDGKAVDILIGVLERERAVRAELAKGSDAPL
jgi:hypothetical protein